MQLKEASRGAVNWKEFVQQNQIYISAFFLLWGLAAYALFAIVEKGDVILFFAGHRTDFLNAFFVFCTQIGEAYVYALATTAFLFIAYSKTMSIGINAIFVLLFSGALKYYFKHERPVNYYDKLLEQPDLPNYVPDVELLQGWTTSFPSGHTISAFAFYTLLAFFISNQWGKLLCLLAAVLVGVSRMYLVQHFLKDVTSGMLTGFLIALFVFVCHERWWKYKWTGRLQLKKGAA